MVCTQLLLGVVTHHEQARPTKQYNAVRKKVKLGTVEVKKQNDINQTKIQRRRQTKLDHASTWINYIATVFAECGYDEKKEGTLFLPYDTFRELYDEYVVYHSAQNAGIFEQIDRVTACREVFRMAWISLKGIKLRTAKGAFETCCVCNNLNDCLKDSKCEWKVK